MDNNFYGITYEDWEKYVGYYLNISDLKKKSHLQSYPFSEINDREKILSRDFFEAYIASGLFLNSQELETYKASVPKNDGNLRSITLVSPIIFLVLIVIGGRLSEQVKTNNYRRSIYYSGNYSKGILNYSKPYKDFQTELLSLQNSYKFYLKTDISLFYPSLDFGKLFSRMQDLCVNESARSLTFYRYLLEYIGNGKYPVVPDNTGLSYISTVIYMDEFDKQLINALETDNQVQDYYLVRYVDDLYVLFNCKEKSKAENNIKMYLQEIATGQHLSINLQKQKVSNTEDIREDVYSNIYDYFVNDSDIQYSDIYTEKQIINLLTNLLKLPAYPSHENVNKVLSECLDDQEYHFYYTEILNWYLYENQGVFQKPTVKILLKVMIDRQDIIAHYPRQFGRMIVNTRDNKVIKKYLNSIFKMFRSRPVPGYVEYLAFEYLMAHNFRHKDLKYYISKYSPKMFEYVKKFCLTSYKLPEVNNQSEILSKMNGDCVLNFLKFLAMYYYRKSLILESFAYYKNFFDRKLTYYFALLDVEGVSLKSFQFTYKSQQVMKVLKELSVDDISSRDLDILKNAYIARNENPVNHASSGILKSSNLKSSEVKCYISTLSKVLRAVGQYCKTHADCK